ncbi:MAG: class I SAM-dependent methyltransferase [Kiritimatiellia bacterium]
MSKTSPPAVQFEWKSEDFPALVESCSRDEVTPYLLEYLPRGGMILDAGCGLGRYVEFLTRRGYRVVGVEINMQTVASALKVAPHLDVRVGDVAALDFEPCFFDAVYSLGVLEHFAEGPIRVLHELWRVLKPGGMLLATVPSFNLVRQAKYHTGRCWTAINPVKKIKRSHLLRCLLGKPPPVESQRECRFGLRGTPFCYRHQHDTGRFYQYLFGPREFPELVRSAKFEVLASVPVARMDGFYHDISRRLVRFENWRFYPAWSARILNALLGTIPFVHNHMHLCVARKITH